MLSLVTSSRLLRFLLSLLVRFRLSLGRFALALRARFASVWRSALMVACRKCRSYGIPLHASNIPMDEQMRERLYVSERTAEEEEGAGTLATLPVLRSTFWEDELFKYQGLTPSHGFEFWRVTPSTPERASQRYNLRQLSWSPGVPGIPVGQEALLSALPPLPDGWRRHIHPEGNVFFYHEGLRIFTENDIIFHEEDILFYATRLIEKAIETDGVIMDEFTEIVLNMDRSRNLDYYFVDHRHRLLFWVDPVEPRVDLGTDLQMITGYSHIRYLIEAHYWYASFGDISELRSHCEYYPHNRTLPKGVFEDLRGMLNFAKTDMITAKSSSTSPFEQDELLVILDFLNSLKDDGRISDPYSIWATARLMAIFTRDRFSNFYGQPCARLSAGTTLFGQQTWNHSIVFRVINVFLFGSPNEHAMRLQRVWVDGTILQPRWTDFIDKFEKELGRCTLLSTVMLTVNLTFLAALGISAPDTNAGRSEIIIYCSIITTVASIMFYFALLNMYGDPELADANPAALVMKTLSQRRWGMPSLAIMHGLPIACLTWSIALFSTALAMEIYGKKELAAVTPLGIECLILVLFGFMSGLVMHLFSCDDSGEDADDPTQNDASSEFTKSEHDVELGLTK